MLTPPHDPLAKDNPASEEGYHDGTLTIGLNSKEFDVYKLILQLASEERTPGKICLLLGSHLDNFLNYFRKSDLLYYIKRGKRYKLMFRPELQ